MVEEVDEDVHKEKRRQHLKQKEGGEEEEEEEEDCLLYTSPSPRDRTRSRMPSSA